VQNPSLRKKKTTFNSEHSSELNTVKKEKKKRQKAKYAPDTMSTENKKAKPFVMIRELQRVNVFSVPFVLGPRRWRQSRA
jgi:hypothetical protein